MGSVTVTSVTRRRKCHVTLSKTTEGSGFGSTPTAFVARDDPTRTTSTERVTSVSGVSTQTRELRRCTARGERLRKTYVEESYPIGR
ncbi:hypothetical protein B296_00041814 [Ensete ventricosum]|uniref:Uncharacterized protein n=1 Tax=Ensete ventricosum TaxID=4639 RepID=A0A426YW71_ENSVE|nr:hypothetical protein B296_00041814 [Ensete ventricosum]